MIWAILTAICALFWITMALTVAAYVDALTIFDAMKGAM